jgi:hypothetical protein
MQPIVLLLTLAVGLMVAATSLARPLQTRPVAPNQQNNIYQSHSLGHQSYPNPDRDYLGENRYPATPAR